MKRTLIVLLAIIPFLTQAQLPKTKTKTKKYPSLLWEITGNGLKKPSYLFGTMHVSSKIAFHLADSFYLGIRSADVVALETNPESWQEDMTRYEMSYGGSDYPSFGSYGNYLSAPDDYFTIKTLKFFKYDRRIERTLYSNPSSINNLLYRTYGNEASDFEEDTYLDMYIYQCGKKWGKKVAGVERYEESMKLMQEAYRDAAKDKNRKERSYDVDEEYSTDKLQESYRKGNLDQLDSINRLNSFSDAFDEKFLYRRNEIQANSIDSILKKSSLFVGVGAAHLPGSRGVIEMLRQKGYKLRPIMMGERDSHHKDEVEKIRVPVQFNTEAAEDDLFKVDIPGKFYKMGEDANSMQQKQYADMANGSYYMVTRIMTNAWLWGHGPEDVYKKIDSLLYENIPGKIISKTRITKNGYTGFDIVNKTRRGDVQRYNILITPFEVIVFKMSGTGEYVALGEEAKKFFGSIQLKEYNPTALAGWKKYSPSYGGFSVELPHEPFVGNDGSWIYDAEDNATGTQFRVIRSDIHNHSFVEEDTFDLGLMDESFSASEFIDKQISRKQTTFRGYPALDCKYKDKSGGIYAVRYLIQGPHYYTLVAHGKKEVPKMQAFLNSFEIKPFVYGEVKERKDTSLYFTVKSPVFPESKKEKLDFGRPSYYDNDDDEEDNSELNQLEEGAYRNKIISNDTTGEKIFVAFYRSARYYYTKDSSKLDADSESSIFMGDSTWIVRNKKKYELPNKVKVWDFSVSDTGSSRMLMARTFYKDGIGFALMTQLDTLTPPSSFIRSFFDSFSPADTLKGINPFTKKSNLFFDDFMSKDSVSHKRAIKNIQMIDLDSSDLPGMKKVIASLSWKEKNYLDVKKSLIGKISDMPVNDAADYLKQTYYAAGDTIELQYVALEALLKQQTQYAFNVFRDIMTVEPPILEGTGSSPDWSEYSSILKTYTRQLGRGAYMNDNFVDDLYDSLKLTRTILPDLMPLLNIDDYKTPMMTLLGSMVDSNLVKPKDYETYFSKFMIEARQELKRQAIREKKAAIEKAEESKSEKKESYSYYDDEEKDYGNDDLELYATLLLPYWDINPNVQPVIQQMLRSNDKKLRYNTMLLLLRNGKPCPDSLLNFFGGMDEYRYQLYSELKRMKKLDKFPAKFNNHLDLGRSSLLASKSYGKPDTLAYVDRLPMEYKKMKGFIYFFKYKSKKDDANWKLATVGLVPADPKQFEYEIQDYPVNVREFVAMMSVDSRSYSRYDFTDFTDTKIDVDEPLIEQLKKELKKKLYSRRNSAREFYGEGDSDRYDMTEAINFRD